MALLTHFPARAAVNSGFGWRVHPITSARTLHEGQDRGWAQGKDIYAARSGVVVLASYNGGYGNLVIIDHGFVGGVAYRTRYAHNASFKVSVGQQVIGGQVIAIMGTTGNSTGVHNHFELRKSGLAIDPGPYFPSSSGTAGDTGTPFVPETEEDAMYLIRSTSHSIDVIVRNDGYLMVSAAPDLTNEISSLLSIPIASNDVWLNSTLALLGAPDLGLMKANPGRWFAPVGQTPVDIAGIVAGVLGPLVAAVNASIGGIPAADLSPILTKLDSINANIDDQPTEFEITPKS